jgi:hypothetical protein
MTEQVPSDAVLAELLRIAEADYRCIQATDIDPRILIALIECTKSLKPVIAAWDRFYQSMSPQDQAEDTEFGELLRARGTLERLEEACQS